MMANIVDPDQTPQNAASDLDLQCLLGFVCRFTYGTHYISDNSISISLLGFVCPNTYGMHYISDNSISISLRSYWKSNCLIVFSRRYKNVFSSGINDNHVFLISKQFRINAPVP